MNPPNEASPCLFDASAVLALLIGEPGAGMVRNALPGACISAVNAAEVMAKLVRNGMPLAAAVAALDALRLNVLPFAANEAVESARLAATKSLSLGDRACLATALLNGWPVFTADKEWVQAAPSLKLILIR